MGTNVKKQHEKDAKARRAASKAAAASSKAPSIKKKAQKFRKKATTLKTQPVSAMTTCSQRNVTADTSTTPRSSSITPPQQYPLTLYDTYKSMSEVIRLDSACKIFIAAYPDDPFPLDSNPDPDEPSIE
jgi:hypothetical protein